MPEAAQVAEPPKRAPFNVGARVVLQKHPGAALTVLAVGENATGAWVVRAGHSEQDYVAAPTDNFVTAPVGYIDPPTEPVGAAASGLSRGAWEAKREHDEADRGYQVALVRYHTSMVAWATEHATRVNPDIARSMIETHKFLLARAVSRSLGQDPDATEMRRAA
jgi:hypothetical protein